MANRRGRAKNPYVRYQKLDKPPVSLHRTTLWDYPSQHYPSKTGVQGSAEYRGATPSHVIWNVVSRWSKAGQLVVDPFCGSGTTLDVCRDLGRVARGFDIAPARDDVERGDARALPIDDEAAALVFMDPPYADNLRYSGDPLCLGETRAEDGTWQRGMREVLGEAERMLAPGGTCAVFLCDVLKPQRELFLPLGLYAAAAAEDAGMHPIEHVAVVRRGRTLEEGRGASHASREGFLLRGFSHLLVFGKPKR